MIVYRIELPKEQDTEAFVTFMREDYLPAIHTGSTRVGQVLGLAVWQEEPDSEREGHTFLLHVEWSGLGGDYAQLRLDDEAVEGRLATFGARLQRLGFYREVVTKRQEEGKPTG
ncbi:hypothetical protein [Deinococcus planocerae]|uniref:hypothetical protein n=1 Tax=Deinococcus planocerae TaxID=1737569 RepID=UPI000C7E9B6E|nr:hypothetical protein [Deinococcus planocerae]